jgi:hypothetical protein
MVKRIGELGTTLTLTSKPKPSAEVVPSSTILVTLIIEMISFSETSALTRATQHNVPEDGILHAHFPFKCQCIMKDNQFYRKLPAIMRD